MNELLEPAVLALTQGPTGLAPAAWDLLSAIKNATNYLQGIFGLVIVAMGVIGLGVGAVLASLKIWGSQQMRQKLSWGNIGAAIIVGGAMMIGGWPLIASVGSGGQQTIEELGGGTVLLQLTSALF